MQLTEAFQQILKKKQDLIFQPSRLLLNSPPHPSVQRDTSTIPASSTDPSSSSFTGTCSITDIEVDSVLHTETSSWTAHSAVTSTPVTEHVSIVNSTMNTGVRMSKINYPEVTKAITTGTSVSRTKSNRSTAVTDSPEAMKPLRSSKQITTTPTHSSSSHPRAEAAVVMITGSNKASVEKERVSQSRRYPVDKQVHVDVSEKVPSELCVKQPEERSKKQSRIKISQHSVKTKEPHLPHLDVLLVTESTSNKKTTKSADSSKDIPSKIRKRIRRSTSSESDTETRSRRSSLELIAFPDDRSQPSVKRLKSSRDSSPLQLRKKNTDKVKAITAKLHASEQVTSPSDLASCSRGDDSSLSVVTVVRPSERDVQKQDNSNNNSNSNALSIFSQASSSNVSTETKAPDGDKLLQGEPSGLGSLNVVDSLQGKGGSRLKRNQQVNLLPSFHPHPKSVLCVKVTFVHNTI